MKVAILLAYCAMHAGCVQGAARSTPTSRRAADATSHPRFSRIEAVALAEQVAFPNGFSRSAYRFSGTAIYYAPLRQWGIGYDPKMATVIPGDAFNIWIDDTTGNFTRYGYGR